MQLLRLSALVLSLIAAHNPAKADVAPPALSIGIPDLSNLGGLELNQWYVGANAVMAGNIVDGQLSQNGGSVYLPSVAELTRTAQDSQASGSKLGSASARVSLTSLGANASAIDPLYPMSTSTVSVGYSVISYWALLDQDTSFKFNLQLNGQLSTLGERAGDPERSGAAVAALAFGSVTGFNAAEQQAIYETAGLGAFAEGGDPLLQQLVSLESSTQTHLDAFGAQTSTALTSLDVDTTLQVTANGTQINCDTPISPACGRYFYTFGVMLFTGAQNGGLADFSHTLQINSVSVDGGEALPFGAISAVPEPTTGALLAVGVISLLGVVSRRRR
ncbi:PEP-CTERM sorting domain-containing protein [Roseateles sp.]|uniref:PEP-CTERM sorting domain-containing protein n=1 Tax=Roseateles sp. TaxID=1971397 RepID=UPI003264060E